MDHVLLLLLLLLLLLFILPISAYWWECLVHLHLMSLLVFTVAVVGRLLVFKITCSVPQIPQNSTVLTQIYLIFLSNCSLYCCKPSVNSQSFEKVDVKIFCKLMLKFFAHFFITFVEEWIFRGPCFSKLNFKSKSDHSITIKTQLVFESAFLPIRMGKIRKKEGCRSRYSCMLLVEDKLVQSANHMVIF